MQLQNIEDLPPEVQKSVKAQLMMQKMNSYGKEIKVINGSPTEISNFHSYQKMKEMADFIAWEEGCGTYLVDEKYPMRICMAQGKMETITQFKKLLPKLAISFQGNIINKLIALLYLKRNWINFIDFVYYGLRDVYYKEVKYYNQPAREMYRVLSGWNELIDKIRDILCSVIEWDTAYRYRFQDILPELNKELFYKNPAKEIQRLFNILIRREDPDDGGPLSKYGRFIPLLKYYFLFNKKLEQQLKEIVKKIDLDEIKLSKEDIYWTNQAYGEYKFKDVPYSERIKIYEKEKEEYLKIKYNN